MKHYEDLPAYFSGWDVALLPFAQNDATRFISPTKTPEYLAAGLPVVTTPIRDVERLYGNLGLVVVGRNDEEFLRGIEQQLLNGRSPRWRSEVKSFLGNLSWDKTWSEMERLVLRGLLQKRRSKSKVAALAALKPRASVAGV
jgi:glycosyltransferase involved in cell wall biosynthesis